MTGQLLCGRRRRGQSLIEFTFVGIPLMFILISIFEISRGMWMYHTLAYSVTAGVRYAIVHGESCGAPYDSTASGLRNNCQVYIGDIAKVIQDAGVGLDPNTTTLSFISSAGTTSCTSLTACVADKATVWPPANGNSAGQTIEIDIQTPFRSAIAMFWPGSKPVSFAVVNFPATASEAIQF